MAAHPHSGKGKERLYLVDGSGYIFRAYYAIRPLSTRTGLPTNAVIGVARMLLKLIREEKPHLIGVAFDSREKTFRHDIYADYKANRDEPPEDLQPQFALIHELVESMDIPVLKLPGFEADDIIATLATEATKKGHPVTVVSGDKDLMQLVSDDVSMLDEMKEKRYQRNDVIERFGVPPEQVAEVLALAGDSSDNVPGVPSVGPKSAAKLVSSYGDIEHIYNALQKIAKPKAYEQAVVTHIDQARLSKRLVTLRHDAPVPFDVEALRYSTPDPARLSPFLHKIEATSLLRDMGFDAVTSAQSTPSQAAPAPSQAAPSNDPIDRSTYRTILELHELDALLDAIYDKKHLCFDLETTSLDALNADLVGIALAVPEHAPCYVPLAHRYLGAPKQLRKEVVLERLRPIFSDRRIKKVGQNLKYDTLVLTRAGVEVNGFADDAMLAAYVLDPSRPSFGLDALSRQFLGHENIHYKDITTQGKKQIGFDEVDIPTATAYAAEDADVALRLCNHLRTQVKEAGMESLYTAIEMPLEPVLIDMERTGILVDVDELAILSKELRDRLDKVEAEVQRQVGEKINLASPKQLATLLFDKLGLKTGKKTKTGFSTDQEVLENLAKEHELPALILEHRLLAKLKSTYVDALPKMRNSRSGRIHTSYNQTGAATGRLSSVDPNLQNIPIRTEEGQRIRAAFKTLPGWVLISADYSQIELRVMAHLSEDPAFIEAFHRNEDIHEHTAREVLTSGKKPDAMARRRAKAINFGILYGLSEFGLAKQLGIPRQQAHQFIATYFSRYPRIRHFLDHSIETARELGYSQTLAGRRRFLPDLRSKNGNVRMAAERVAMNTPIQGSAADLIKKAMINVHQSLRRERLRTRMLLQVHDELVFETPKEEVEKVTQLIRHDMETVVQLKVPLVVDIGAGSNWAQAH